MSACKDTAMGATLTALNHQATGTRHMFTGFCAVVMMLLSEMERGQCHLERRNKRVTLGRLSYHLLAVANGPHYRHNRPLHRHHC